MGCGCNRKKGTFRRTIAPSVSINRGITTPNISAASVPATPGQIRALGVQANTVPKSSQRLTAERNRIEQLRRKASLKRFGK
jgi:hypothetical protein